MRVTDRPPRDDRQRPTAPDPGAPPDSILVVVRRIGAVEVAAGSGIVPKRSGPSTACSLGRFRAWSTALASRPWRSPTRHRDASRLTAVLGPTPTATPCARRRPRPGATTSSRSPRRCRSARRGPRRRPWRDDEPGSADGTGWRPGRARVGGAPRWDRCCRPPGAGRASTRGAPGHGARPGGPRGGRARRGRRLVERPQVQPGRRASRPSSRSPNRELRVSLSPTGPGRLRPRPGPSAGPDAANGSAPAAPRPRRPRSRRAPSWWSASRARSAVPGWCEVPAGARVADALAAAGGALPGTDLTQLNLARRVSDGEQVAVGVPPAPDAARAAGRRIGRGTRGGRPGAPAGRLDLNAASVEQLDGLPGSRPGHRPAHPRVAHPQRAVRPGRAAARDRGHRRATVRPAPRAGDGLMRQARGSTRARRGRRASAADATARSPARPTGRWRSGPSCCSGWPSGRPRRRADRGGRRAGRGRRCAPGMPGWRAGGRAAARWRPGW